MKVRFTRPALTDLETILDYIAAHSPKGARKVQSRIGAFIGLLAVHPLIGTRTDDPSIRRLPTLPYPYLIFYEVAEEEIIIHAVCHTARDPSSMPGPA
ncbi:MAG: type II toxin-antitoxin system RelE/ParE family toxin [Methylocella sp.]